MKIVNKDNLSYEEIGKVIDFIINNSYDDTKYVGKIDVCTIRVGYKIIKVQIRYMKRDIEWIFTKAGENDAM